MECAESGMWSPSCCCEHQEEEFTHSHTAEHCSVELDSEVSDARQLVVSVFHNLFGLPEWSVVSFGVIDSDWSIKNETKERDIAGRSDRVGP